EDGLAIARLTRAYPQRVHKIPVPIQLNYDEVRRKIDSYREQMDVDTTVTYDSTSAGFRMVGQSSPTNVDTDYYLPRLYTPDGKFVDGDVENLPADNPYLTDLDDIYLDLRRLICALNVPLEYLNMRVGQRSFVDKASEEAQESFAYLIRHVQMAYAHGLRQIFDLQLLLKGINPLEAKYEVMFPVVSPIATKRSAQVDAIRANVAMVWAKLGIPAEVIGRSALHLSRDDLERWLQATGGKISTEGLEKWIDYALMQLKPDEEEEGEKEYEPAGADTAATR
ncbi:MAG: portal protein, partial [Deltaproteobacteria bacterium]|nr:portal protein [Deltaproteobacteria bacterium]